MIKYSLICELHHLFEGWFSDSESFEKQSERDLISCPECGSDKIRRALMTPNLSTGKHNNQLVVPDGAPKSEVPKVDGAMYMEQNPNIPLPADKQTNEKSKQKISPEQVITMVRNVRRYIEANGRNVGNKFAEEALKIHYGEEKQDIIYGTCTPEEGDRLADEGVEFSEIPLLPKVN
jgi:hypothetical protein